MRARSDDATIRSAALRVRDWNRVVERAAASRVAPWVDAGVRSLADNSTDIPARALSALHSIATRAAVRQAQLRALLALILTGFTEAGIPAIVLKGMAMVLGVYEKPHYRMVRDIDLLLHPSDIPAASAHLRTLGATQLPEGDLTLHAPPFIFSDDLVVELHSGIVPLTWGRVIPPERLWADAHALAGDARCSILAPAHLLLHAAVHATLGHLGVGMLYQFRDMHEIIRCYGSAIAWDALVDDAQSSGIAWPVSLALQGASGLVDAHVPETVITALDPTNHRWSPRRTLVTSMLPRLAVTFDGIGPLRASNIIGTLPELLIGDQERTAWKRVGAAFLVRGRRWAARGWLSHSSRPNASMPAWNGAHAGSRTGSPPSP